MSRILQRSIQIIALAMVVAQLVYIFNPFTTFSRFSIIHVAFSMALVILIKASQSKKKAGTALLILLFLTSMAALIYTYSQASRLELRFGMGLDAADFWVGVFILVIFTIAIYLVWGPIIPLIMTIGIIYFFFGSNIPGVMGFPYVNKEYVMTYLAMGISTGVFGYLLPESAKMIFYFMLFGGILGSVGVMPLFLEVGKWLGQLIRGGAAMTAVVGSSLVGTVTGATVANVAFTGQYTIPTMKSQGFTPQSAAAIEQVASSGGQIMPPIMGAGAFLMAVILGVPYWDIVVRAIIPAILYYVLAVIGIIILIRQYNIRPEPETVDKALIASRAPLFVLPLGILIFLLYLQWSPGKAVSIAFFLTTAMAITYAVLSRMGMGFFQRGHKFTVGGYIKGVVEGAITGAEMAVAIVAISVVAQVAISTQLGPKIGHALMGFAGGSEPVALLMIMAACIVLGMGMPTVAAYTVVAIVMVPTLTMNLGADKFGSHFFVFYYAVFAAITPPVATAAIVSSKIAGCSFWSAGLHGFKLALPLFFMPFAWMIEPQVLNFPHVGLSGLFMILVVLFSGLAMAITLYRYFLLKLNRWEWGLAFGSVGMLMGYIVLQGDAWLVTVSLIMVAIIAISQYWRSRQIARTHS